MPMKLKMMMNSRKIQIKMTMPRKSPRLILLLIKNVRKSKKVEAKEREEPEMNRMVRMQMVNQVAANVNEVVEEAEGTTRTVKWFGKQRAVKRTMQMQIKM